jgi:uncharacterized membrane protein
MDLIFGLPLHPLVIHAAVVFIPLAAIGALIVLFTEKARKKFIPVVTAAVVVASASAFVASESGEALAKRVGLPQEHAIQGERLWKIVFLFTLLFFIWAFYSRKRRKQSKFSNIIKLTLRLAVTVTALVSIALTFVVGHSGADATWKYRVQISQPSADNE